MGLSIISKISLLQRAAFSLATTHVRTQIIAGFRPSGDANFVMPRARAFSSLDIQEVILAVKRMHALEKEKVSKRVFDLCKKKRVLDIDTIPSEILGSEERLRELFELWMAENEKTYPSYEEKMRRFEGFKDSVFKLNEWNLNGRNGRWERLHWYADYLPTDPPRK